MKVKEFKKIIEEALSNEVRDRIIAESEAMERYVIKEKNSKTPIEACASDEEARKKIESYKKEGKEFIIEKMTFTNKDEYLQYLTNESDQLEENESEEEGETQEELVGKQEKLDVNKNGKIDADDFKKLKNDDINETHDEVDSSYTHFAVNKENGKIFTGWDYADLDKDSIKHYVIGDLKDLDLTPKDFKISSAKALQKNGIDPFDFSNWAKDEGKTEYSNNLNASHVDESKEKTIRTIKMNESDLIKTIEKIIKETADYDQAYVRSHKGAGKQNTQALKDVENKIKDYLNFDGNDNPEFPKQINKGDKMAINNTDEENEFVDDNRGKGLQDLVYDHEPSKNFKERSKKALEGDSTMGNAQDEKKVVNVVKTDTGKNIAKGAERELKKDKKAPMYQKDPAPIKNINESTEKDLEIEKFKKLSSYNQKTQ